MPGGTISGTGAITTSTGGSIYNGGTISLSGTSGITFNSGGKMYNAGTLTLSNLTLNTGANLVNYGTASVNGTLYAPANGYVYNANGASIYAGVIQLISGATLINHSEKCHFGSATGDVDNANFETTCKMIIDGTFTPKSLIISSGGSVQCKDLVFHYATINMGPNAILEATNSTTLQGVTVNGPTSGSNYAICVFGTIPDNGYGTEAFNNLVYIDIKSHPTPAKTGDWCWFTNDVTTSGSASIVGQGEANQAISSDDCSIGYTSKIKGGDTDGSEFSSSYCFEDNYPAVGDYDFNDVVMDVARTVSDKIVTLKVTLRAVGATKQLGAAIRLYGIASSDINSVSTSTGFEDTAFGSLMEDPKSNGYVNSIDGKSIVIPLFGDAHKALTGSTTRAFINTKEGETAYPSKTVTITINTKSANIAKSISSSTVDPFIYNGTSEVHTNSWKTDAALYSVATNVKTGVYVWAVQVPNSFKYPIEYTSITSAYSGFATWAQKADNSAWYTNFDTSKVY
jgi:LruC domain-containing protein